MHDYLKQILAHKHDEVESLYALNKNFETAVAKRPCFEAALRKPGCGVIAEIKRRSPSKQHLADIKDPVALAKQYEESGAAAISVLTDMFGFGGSIDDLAAVADAVSIPVLRKDFIIDPIQIHEAKAAGASAVLLIVAVLGEETEDFLRLVENTGLSALVEVHDDAELQLAITAGAKIIGVNNRNLTTFNVDINNALDLYNSIPDQAVAVAESGIDTLATAQQFIDCGYDALLIGETLVKADDPATFIHAISEAQA